MGRVFWRLLFFLAATACLTSAAELPFSTVAKGSNRFQELVREARQGGWTLLPIGELTPVFGRAMVRTRYKLYTLEIDDRIEAPSVNFYGMDCWTFFEIALGFARMLNEPEAAWTPERLLHYIELDRYR